VNNSVPVQRDPGYLGAMIARILTLALLAAAAPLAAAEGVASLAGVSDEETVIHSGRIEQFQRGKGDVVFLRDRENKWYRVALNAGCLKGASEIQTMAFQTDGVSGRIDRMTKVNLYDGGRRLCLIDSIRRSEAPPQVDSKSRVTLD